METRKIQVVGGGTYSVSLPKHWAETADVSAGSVVNLHTHLDGLLVIQPQEQMTEAPARNTVQISDDSPATLERTLRAAYAAGSMEIVLDATDAFTGEQRRIIEHVTRNLTGVTVVGDSESQVTVRTLLNSSEVSIHQSVRQLQFIALSMQRAAVETLTGDATMESLADRDDQADRLHAMIDRHFARGLARLDEVDALGVTRPELFKLWAASHELERVADLAENIARNCAGIDGPIDESTADTITDLARVARGVVADAVSVIIGDATVETAHQALNDRDRVREKSTTLDQRLFESSTADYRLTRISDSLRRTAEHGGNIAEYGLRRAIHRDELAAKESDTGKRHSDRESHPPTDSD